MSGGREEILEFNAAVTKNRNVFLLNHPYAFHAFGALDDQFGVLGSMLQRGRDKHRKTYVSFIPLLLMMQRQAHVSFQALWSHQSYQAWVLIRPALESALIMGKWVDDKAHVDTWKRRREDPEKYRKAYSGRKLRSASLPRSEALQAVLSSVNDDFMHLNPQYYRRHTTMSPVGPGSHLLGVDYFDDDADHVAHLLAFLHLVAVVQDSVLSLFRSLFPDLEPVKSVLTSLEAALQDRVNGCVQQHPDRKPILTGLGLWVLA